MGSKVGGLQRTLRDSFQSKFLIMMLGVAVRDRAATSFYFYEVSNERTAGC